MSAPKIDLTKLPHEDFVSLMTDMRKEGARRAMQLKELLGLTAPSGPGRKARDPLADLLGEESTETEDDAPAVSSLS